MNPLTWCQDECCPSGDPQVLSEGGTGGRDRGLCAEQAERQQQQQRQQQQEQQH